MNRDAARAVVARIVDSPNFTADLLTRHGLMKKDVVGVHVLLILLIFSWTGCGGMAMSLKQFLNIMND